MSNEHVIIRAGGAVASGTSNPRCEKALEYTANGWPVLPLYEISNGRCSCGGRPNCKPGKHPRCANGLHDATTDPQQIKQWWKRWPDANIGVLTGTPSGIIVLDIDERHGGHVSLEELVGEYGPLPSTVEAITGSGCRHYLFAHPGGYVKSCQAIRPGIDVKADKGYIVVEPSNHISGGQYCWELSHEPFETLLAEAPSWLLKLIAAHSSSSTSDSTDRENRDYRDTENTEPYGSALSAVSVLSVISVDVVVAQAIAEGIESTAPGKKGQRNDAVFKFARVLKAIPSLAGSDPRWFRPIIRLWHQRAYPVIGTKPFEATWADFLHAFPRVRFPKGKEPMALMFAASEAAEPPTCGSDYESKDMVRLIKLCRELQRHSGAAPFFLACRTAGELLQIDHNTAAAYLRVLCADGILKVEIPHTSTQAIRYRYLPNCG
jgi:hypothetical protein